MKQRKRLPSAKEAELLALTVTERSGLALAEEYGRVTGGDINEGTLYSTLRRLSDAKWVNARESQDQDGRLRYYLITSSGYSALREAYDFHDRVRDVLAKALGQRETEGKRA